MKLQVCQFFGVASDLAMQELSERLERLDRKMMRLEVGLQQIHQQQMLWKAKEVKKTPLRVVKTEPSAPIEAQAEAKETQPKKKPLKKQSKKKSQPPLQKSVLLLGGNEQASQVLQKYFGDGVELIRVNQLSEIPQSLLSNFPKQPVLAVFYERSWLADPENLSVLEPLRKKLAQSEWIGLSSYLTLHLVEEAELGREEKWGRSLTLPLTQEALSEVFENRVGLEPAPTAGRDFPAQVNH